MQANNQTISTSRTGKSKSIYPLLLLALGVLALLFDNYLKTLAPPDITNIIIQVGGIFAIIAGLFAIIAKAGIELDPMNNQYRNFMSFGKFKWGKWQPLAPINYVAVVRIRISQLSFRPSEATFRQSEEKPDIAYNVNLILKDSPNKIIKLFTGNLEAASQLSMEIANQLNVAIYDCTTPNKKWIAPSTSDNNTLH